MPFTIHFDCSFKKNNIKSHNLFLNTSVFIHQDLGISKAGCMMWILQATEELKWLSDLSCEDTLWHGMPLYAQWGRAWDHLCRHMPHPIFVSFFLEGCDPALHYFSSLPPDAVMGYTHHQGVGSGPSTISLCFQHRKLPCMTKSVLFFHLILFSIFFLVFQPSDEL